MDSEFQEDLGAHTEIGQGGGRDRLELVRSTWFMLGALQRSLVGWLQ